MSAIRLSWRRRWRDGGEEGGGARRGACQSDVGSLYSFRQLVECHEDTETKLCGKGGRECGVGGVW